MPYVTGLLTSVPKGADITTLQYSQSAALVKYASVGEISAGDVAQLPEELHRLRYT